MELMDCLKSEKFMKKGAFFVAVIEVEFEDSSRQSVINPEKVNHMAGTVPSPLYP